MKCHKCGKEIESDWLICGHCGTNLLSNKGKLFEFTNRQPKNNTQRILFITIPIIILIVFTIIRILTDINSENQSGESNISSNPTQMINNPLTTSTILITPTPISTINESPLQNLTKQDQFSETIFKTLFSSDYPEITAENATLVREISRIEDGMWSIMDEKGEIISEEPFPMNDIENMALFNEGDILILNGFEHSVVLNLLTQEYTVIESLLNNNYYHYLLSFTPDFKGFLSKVNSSKGNRLKFHDFSTSSILNYETSTNFGYENFHEFSPNGELFAASFDAKTVQVWNVKSGKLLLDIEVNEFMDFRKFFTFSPDSKKFAIMAQYKQNESAYILDTSNWERIFEHQGSITIEFFPTDNLIYTSDGKIWDLNNNSIISEIETYYQAQDKDQLAAHPIFDQLSFENAEALREFVSFPGYTPDLSKRNLHLVPNQFDIDINYNSTYSGSLSGHTGRINSTHFILDNSMIISSADDFTVRFWAIADRPSSKILAGHQAEVQKISFSPDGDKLASIDSNNELFIWDISSRSPISHWQLNSISNEILSINFSDNFSKLLLFSSEKVIIYDILSQESIFEIFHEGTYYTNTVISPMGDYFSVTEVDSSENNYLLKIYNLSDGSVLASLPNETDSLFFTTTSGDITKTNGILADYTIDIGSTISESNGIIKVIDIFNGNVLNSYNVPLSGGVIFSNDDSLLTDGRSIWSVQNLELQNQFTGNEDLIRIPLKFSQDNSILAVLDYSWENNDIKTLKLLNIKYNGSVMKSKEFNSLSIWPLSYIKGFDISPNLDMIALAVGNNIEINKFD